MNKIKVAILGSAGRMGQTLLRCAGKHDNITVSAATEKAGHPSIGKDVGLLSGIENISTVVTDNVQEAFEASDVIIDFTSPLATVANAELAALTGKPLVIGTTGLSEEQIASVRESSKKAPIVMAPNMSLGVNLLFALTKQAASALKGYDIEIIEKHHHHKKDAPSGTAIRLAEKAAEGAGVNLKEVENHGRSGIVGARPSGEIGIHAVRAGDIVGEHTVLFGVDGERVELFHAASGRECFANGALKAAIWLINKKHGLYDMQDVLGIES